MSLPRSIRTGLSLCLLIAGTAMAQSTQVPGFTHVRSLAGIDEYRLDANGLTVLALPDPAAPVVSFQVLYRVGSRNEATGTTGGTHLLEHLMFKGSRHYTKEQGNSVNDYLERAGASFNATTSMDRTNNAHGPALTSYARRPRQRSPHGDRLYTRDDVHGDEDP